MKIKKVKISEINAAEYNPRKDLKPGDAEFEKLKRSIQEFGYVESIIWNSKTGNIVGGHQRLKVMQYLGYTEVDCVALDIDSTKEKALSDIATPTTQNGDLWILGNHRLLCGDSTSEVDVRYVLDGQLADLMVTDPPYNVNYGDSVEFKTNAAKSVTRKDSHKW